VKLKSPFVFLGFTVFVISANTAGADKAISTTAVRKPVVRSVASDPNRKMDREVFYEELKIELEKSLKKTEYSRVEKTVKIENELAAAQDPWSLTNSTQWTNYGAYPRWEDTLNKLTLKYENQNGFSFQTYVDYYNSTQFPNASTGRYSRSNYGISFSQEILSWFNKTAFEINQEITELSGKSKLVAAEGTYLSETLKVVELSHQLFSALCKRKDLDRILKMAEETLKTSEVQQAARTISMRDLIRIKGTFLGVQRQISSADFEIQSAQNQFSAIAPAAQEKARLLSSRDIFCEDNLEKLKSTGYPSRQEMVGLVAKHPAMVNFDFSKDSLRRKFDLYKTNRSFKVTLTGGWDKTDNVEVRDPSDQGFVGLTLSYQFQGGSYDAYKQSIAEQFQDVSVKQRLTQLELTQFLNSLFDQIEYQKSQIPVVVSLIDNANKLIKIIETQQSIGQLDATAIESAVQSEIQAQSEKRSLWSQISSNALKITEIKKASEKASTWK
jgi:hypothetical protein